MPGAQWLTLEVQEMMQQLGYLAFHFLCMKVKRIFFFFMVALLSIMTVVYIVLSLPQVRRA